MIKSIICRLFSAGFSFFIKKIIIFLTKIIDKISILIIIIINDDNFLLFLGGISHEYGY